MKKLLSFCYLMRLDKPIGIFLLLWPALIAFFITTPAPINTSYLFIVIVGAIVTRSAGCVINDIFDKDFDKQVERTKSRPLADQSLSITDAWITFFVLGVVALLLLLLLPKAAILTSIVLAVLIVLYPLSKRVIKIPQLFLGITFGSSVIVVSAMHDALFSEVMWLLFLANFCWIIAYDSYYAMCDQDDDILLGINSSALYWGKNTTKYILLLQMNVLLLLGFLGGLTNMGYVWFVGLFFVFICFIFQLYQARQKNYLLAFKNNNYVGFIILLALLVEKYIMI